MDDGAKAEAVAKYCHYWFLLVPKGLTKDMQIPHNWGILEYDEGTKKIRQKHKAEYREAIYDRGFACSFLRGVERMKEVDKALHYDELKEEMKRELSYVVRSRLDQADRMEANIKEIRDKTRLNLACHQLTDWEISCLNLLMHLRDHDAMSIRRLIFLKSAFEEGIAALERSYKIIEEVTKDFELNKESKNDR